MEITKVTLLKDRELWFDGDSTISANDISDYIQSGIPTSSLFVTELTDEIKQFNRLLLPTDEKITIKSNCNSLSFDWNLPRDYTNFDSFSYCINIIKQMMTEYEKEEANDRGERAVTELLLFRKLNLLDLLTVLIYIINTLKNRDIVYGVGRGSSVSSYLLYLLDVHDVDSFAYDLNISDFIHVS